MENPKLPRKRFCCVHKITHPECAAPATKQKTLTKATAAVVHWCRYSVSASSDIEPVTCDVYRANAKKPPALIAPASSAMI